MLIKFYLISWLILTLICFILILKNKKYIVLLSKNYVDFIFKKWKVIIFLIAFIFLCLIANLGLDPTWDIPETIVMSFLTYYTAPYSVGIIYRYLKGLNNNFYEFYIGIILLFFSSAWFYDIYVLLFLLGEYPLTAFSNLLLSPFFYIFAGLIWNMGYTKKDGVYFTFTKKKWINLKDDKGYFSKIFVYITPIILFMIVIFSYFIYLNV